MTQKEDLQKLIQENRRRLQILEERRAKQGLEVPPSVITEIEDIEAKIEELRTELASNKEGPSGSSGESPESQRGRVGSIKGLSGWLVAGIIIFLVIFVAVCLFIFYLAAISPTGNPIAFFYTATPSATPTLLPPTPTLTSSATLTPVLTSTPTATTTPSPTPSPTPTPVPPTDTATPEPPTPIVTPTPIDKMDALWVQFDDNKGSTIAEFQLTQEKTDQAAEITYNLVEGGYVGIFNVFYRGILSGTNRIGFWYKGRGASNTLEFKLFHAEEVCDDGARKRAVFSTEWGSGTNTGDEWVFKEVDYGAFRYWGGDPKNPDDPPTGCTANDRLDLEKVDKIEFAISSRPHYGDEAGQGVIVIDDVQAK